MTKKITKTVKKTAVKTPAPSRQGILSLADMLVHNMKKYDQNTFGSKESCGTIGCLAGFCYAEQIGTRKFNKLAAEDAVPGNLCVEAGVKKLGLSSRDPVLFGGSSSWPLDLQEEYASVYDGYSSKETNRRKVIVALKALSRTRKNGTIGKKVITKIPQLDALLKG